MAVTSQQQELEVTSPPAGSRERWMLWLSSPLLSSSALPHRTGPPIILSVWSRLETPSQAFPETCLLEDSKSSRQ